MTDQAALPEGVTVTETTQGRSWHVTGPKGSTGIVYTSWRDRGGRSKPYALTSAGRGFQYSTLEKAIAGAVALVTS